MDTTTSYTQRLHNPPFTRSSDGGKMPNATGWQTRHVTALDAPKGPELAIVGLLHAWAAYADQHRARFDDDGIGNDYVLGPAWATIGSSILALLNGECGRLDCGTLDGFIRATLMAEGFDPETL